MNPGSDSFSEPSPYTTHEPTLGRTKFCEPVWKQSMALEWLLESVYIDRTKHRSSACCPKPGNKLLISSPLSPYRVKGCVAPFNFFFSPSPSR